MSKAIKLLLTELDGQEFIALRLFRIDLPLYKRGCGQHIPALTSNLVNMSIKL